MLHRCFMFAVFVHLAISRSTTDAFLGPKCLETRMNRIPSFTRDKSGTSKLISRTALSQKVERYIIHGDNDGGDEDLFIALADKKLTRETEAVVDDVVSISLTSGVEAKPEEVVPLIMNALKNNDTPNKDAGLILVWEFTTDTTKYIFNGNITGEQT